MARNLGGAICLSKQNVRVKKSDHFVSEKKLACLPVPNESGRLLNPYSRAVVPQISKALGPLGHERVQFTLVGLFSRFTIIAASFSRADPGTKRRKKSLLQKQLKSSKPKPFQKESGRLLNVFLFIFLFPVLFLSLSLSRSLSVPLPVPPSLPFPVSPSIHLPLPLLLPLSLSLFPFLFLFLL